jgi:hypothetical protein
LDTDTLKLYSLFVSPIKDENDNWVMRDYRTFLSISDFNQAAYNYQDENATQPNFTVNSTITDKSNSYLIKMEKFNINDKGDVPSITFQTNFDTTNRKLTTAEDIYSFYPDFPLKLTSNSVSECDQILSLLNSYTENAGITVADISDYMSDSPTKKYLDELINSAITNSDTNKAILKMIGGEEKFYLEGIKNNTLDVLGTTVKDKISTIINNILSIPLLDDISTELEKYNNDGELSANEKNKIIRYQTATLINKAFGLNYILSPEERVTASKIKTDFENNSNNEYTVNSAEIILIDKLLNLYSDENIYEVSLAFYKMKSLIKTFDFAKKMNLSWIFVNKLVTGE